MATITKRKNGWSVQVRRKGYPQQTHTLPSKAEAQAWAREQEGRIDRALAPINLRLLKGTTLRDLLNRYVEEVHHWLMGRGPGPRAHRNLDSHAKAWRVA